MDEQFIVNRGCWGSLYKEEDTITFSKYDWLTLEIFNLFGNKNE